LYWCVMRPSSQRFFIHSCIYLRILIISFLKTFLGTNSLSVLMCRKAVNQSILQLQERLTQGIRQLWHMPICVHMARCPWASMCPLPNLVVWLYGIMGILPQLGTNSFTANTCIKNASITALKYAYSYTMTI